MCLLLLGAAAGELTPVFAWAGVISLSEATVKIRQVVEAAIEGHVNDGPVGLHEQSAGVAESYFGEEFLVSLFSGSFEDAAEVRLGEVGTLCHFLVWQGLLIVFEDVLAGFMNAFVLFRQGLSGISRATKSFFLRGLAESLRDLEKKSPTSDSLRLAELAHAGADLPRGLRVEA